MALTMPIIAGSKGSSRKEAGRFGPYYFQELINSGGMADLWMVTDQSNQPYALRLLHDRYRLNLLARRRFLRGCEILSRIHHHELVIGYIDHGKMNGTLYLVMEYIEGDNLKILGSRNDWVLTEYIGNILIDMALALEHIHESGYLHLDFKPENVIVSRNASLRLVDFDLARPKPASPKRFSRNPGTPAYMAPEQLMRQPIDHRADIYAYGVVAYELLTGRKPFPGETAKEILGRQKNRVMEFVPPRELNPDIPAGLERIILKCLEFDPAKRYPFTSVLARDVQNHLYVK